VPAAARPIRVEKDGRHTHRFRGGHNVRTRLRPAGRASNDPLSPAPRVPGSTVVVSVSASEGGPGASPVPGLGGQVVLGSARVLGGWTLFRRPHRSSPACRSVDALGVPLGIAKLDPALPNRWRFSPSRPGVAPSMSWSPFMVIDADVSEGHSPRCASGEPSNRHLASGPGLGFFPGRRRRGPTFRGWAPAPGNSFTALEPRQVLPRLIPSRINRARGGPLRGARSGVSEGSN